MQQPKHVGPLVLDDAKGKESHMFKSQSRDHYHSYKTNKLTETPGAGKLYPKMDLVLGSKYAGGIKISTNKKDTSQSFISKIEEVSKLKKEHFPSHLKNQPELVEQIERLEKIDLNYNLDQYHPLTHMRL